VELSAGTSILSVGKSTLFVGFVFQRSCLCTCLSARRPGTPNVILIAATLVFFFERRSHSSFASGRNPLLSVTGQEHTGFRRKVLLISDVGKLLFRTTHHNNPQPDHGVQPTSAV
jgi:hypothetical protein